MSLINFELPLNEIKPFVLANVSSQCKNENTARMTILGPPGCGKSDLLRQICAEQNWGLSVKYLSNMSSEQITGIPCHVKDGEHAKFTKPELINFENLDFMPNNYQIGVTPTILLIDDFHLADKIMQKYLFQLLTYKKLNGYALPKNTAIIMAGNRLSDKALAHSIPAPIMNRICVYNVRADSKDWIENFAFKNNVRADIISFINSYENKYFIQEPLESLPWASPRSWTFLSDQLNELEEMFGDIPTEKLTLVVDSLIGSEYASAFISYKELYSKWDMNKLSKITEDRLSKLFSEEIGKNPINAYAIINSAINWMISNANKYDFDATNPDLKLACNFTYKVMTILLYSKCFNIQIKPLVIAGTNYLYIYQKSLEKDNYTKAEKFRNVRKLFFANMMQDRSVDYIYLEIIANIFGITLDADDKKKIEKAKEALKN